MRGNLELATGNRPGSSYVQGALPPAAHLSRLRPSPTLHHCRCPYAQHAVWYLQRVTSSTHLQELPPAGHGRGVLLRLLQ